MSSSPSSHAAAPHPAAIRRILAPVDLTASSRASLAFACSIAAPLGAAVEVLFVSPIGCGVFEHSFLVPRESASTALRRFVEGVVGNDAVEVTRRVEAGNPPERIAEIAAASAADLIVVGTHARSGRSRSLAGSVAETLVRTAPCPVITVRERG